MLRCTIELVPHGDETRKRVIGLVEIANTGTGTLEVGNYAVVLKKTPPFSGALRGAWKRGLQADLFASPAARKPRRSTKRKSK